MRILLAVLLAIALPACGAETPPEAPPGDVALTLVEGERPAGGFLVSAGQPDEARFREVARSGVAILSLRAAAEEPFDEAAVAQEVGAIFARTPVSKTSIHDAAVRATVYDALDAAAKRPGVTYVHCRSGNRVGALWALYRAEREGKPLEEAIADGKRAGLTKLEPVVRAILDAGR